MEEAEQNGENESVASSTVSANYRETVELVKKYIRVDIPSSQPLGETHS